MPSSATDGGNTEDVPLVDNEKAIESFTAFDILARFQASYSAAMQQLDEELTLTGTGGYSDKPTKSHQADPKMVADQADPQDYEYPSAFSLLELTLTIGILFLEIALEFCLTLHYLLHQTLSYVAYCMSAVIPDFLVQLSVWKHLSKAMVSLSPLGLGSATTTKTAFASAWPPTALIVLAVLTVVALIVHPDGYTWIFLRKIRDSLLSLVQSSSTCWAVVINDYGAVLSTALALCTFAALFFFAYVLRKTLSPRPKDGAVDTEGTAMAQHRQKPTALQDKQRRKKRKGNQRGNHNRNMSKTKAVDEAATRLISSEAEPSAPQTSDAEKTETRSKALPVVLEDKPISLPLKISPASSATLDGNETCDEPATGKVSAWKTVSSPSSPPVYRDRSSSTDESIATLSSFDDHSMDGSASGRSTPTPSVPVLEKPSMIVSTLGNTTKAKPTTKRSGPGSSGGTGTTRAKGKQQQSRKENCRRGRKNDSTTASSGGSTQTREPARNVVPSTRNLPQSTYPRKTSRPVQAARDGSQNLSVASSSAPELVVRGSRRKPSRKIAQKQRVGLKTLDGENASRGHQNVSSFPGKAPKEKEAVSGDVLVPVATPIRPHHNVGHKPEGASVACEANEFCLYSPARGNLLDTPFATPGSVSSSSDRSGSYLTSVWNKTNADGANWSSSDIRAPPGLPRPNNEVPASSLSTKVTFFPQPEQGPDHAREYSSMLDLAPTSRSAPSQNPFCAPPVSQNGRVVVKDNPFDDERQIEAELQELGGQMIGSVLDF